LSALAGTASCSSGTRWVIAGGTTARTNVIQYVTIASAGNATDFGDLLATTSEFTGTSSSTIGIFAGGNISAATNVIQYITIATTGNAIDFGDLTVARSSLASTSAVHGGL